MVPVAKGRPRFGNGRTFTPQATREAEEVVREQIGTKYRGKPFDGALRVQMTFFMPIPKSLSEKKRKSLVGEPHIKRPDVDNLQKLVLDSLNGIVYVDDSQIAEAFTKKVYSDTPKIEVHFIKL